MELDKNKLNSIEKTLKVLSVFQKSQKIWGVRELAAHLEFNPATVQRILKALKAYGFVNQDLQTRQYRIGNVFFRYLDALQNSYSINKAAIPLMKQLESNTQETVHLNVIENMERICIESIESSQNLRASMITGNRSPLYAGASSKCLLTFSSKDFIENYLQYKKLTPMTNTTITNIAKLRAELKKIQKKGYADSLGERTPGLGSLSAPILNNNGEIVASISLAIPEIRYNDVDHRNYCLKELLSASQNCSKAIGYTIS